MTEAKQLRQDSMSSQERLTAILSRQRPDRVPFMPFVFGYSARMVGYPVRSFYDNAEKSFWSQMWTAEMFGYDGGALYSYASLGGWEFGGDIKMPATELEQAPVVARLPAETPDEVDGLEIPDVETAGAYPIAIEFAKIQRQLGMPIMVMGVPPFTAAGNIVGVEMICRWLLKKPEVVHTLLGKVLAFAKRVVDYFVDNFAEHPLIVYSGMAATSSNQIISPKQFEEFVLPYQKELNDYTVQRGIRHIFAHICGEQNLNLPYWAQMEFGQPGILSFGHEVDLTKAIEVFGDKHAIAGNIDSPMIQEGTWQEVYEMCRAAIEKAKMSPNGYLLMAGCEVPVLSPPYNVYVMKKAVMDFGFYD